MKIIQQAFCRHEYEPMTGYVNICHDECRKCGKIVYNDSRASETEFGPFEIELTP